MHIWFGERRFSAELIRDGNWAADSGYAHDTLAFCQSWLRGQAEFTLHTSGSTGKPKPITLHRKQMEASAALTAEAVGLRPHMVGLIALNTAYIAGIMMLVRCMQVGMDAIVIEPTRNPLAGGLSPAVRGPVFTALVPMQVQAILDAQQSKAIFGRFHSVLLGGGPVNNALQQRLSGLNAACYHTYGMTETVSHVALRRLNGPHASDRFYPQRGVTVTLDARGCLVICGPMTLDQPVVTNDRVELADDGSFVWLGRADNVINSGGVKVQAEKVEAALAKAFATDRVFVHGLPDAQLGQRVTAFIERDSLSGNLSQQEQAVSGLTRYELPKRFVYVDQFAETPTGKIDRLATISRASKRT